MAPSRWWVTRPAGSRRRTSRGLSLVAGAFLLTACGGSQTAAPPPVSSTPPMATPASWTAEGPSFGVDRARWPTTVGDAKALLDRLPPTLAGRDLETYASPGEDGSGPDAGAGYGEDVTVTVSEEYLTDDTADGSRELMRARDLLAANFGLGLACSPDSYEGNALPVGDEDGYPEVSRGEPVWFACAVDTAEGDESFTAHAVGWTSGKTAWLVLAPDSTGVRSLVTALHDAAA